MDIQAFPRTPGSEDGYYLDIQEGMTLRDYFAANIVHAIISEYSRKFGTKSVVNQAYDVADEMLKRRMI